MTSRTRAPVIRLAPERSECTQNATSADAFEPRGQPHSQVPQRAHCSSSRKRKLGMATVPGHQCQPSLFSPGGLAAGLPSGCGGSG